MTALSCKQAVFIRLAARHIKSSYFITTHNDTLAAHFAGIVAIVSLCGAIYFVTCVVFAGPLLNQKRRNGMRAACLAHALLMSGGCMLLLAACIA